MLLLLLFPGKRVETIQKHLQQVFTEGAWHQPAVVLLDDLDQVISAPSPTQEIGGEALYKLRLAEGETFRSKRAQRALEGPRFTTGSTIIIAFTKISARYVWLLLYSQHQQGHANCCFNPFPDKGEFY